MTEHLDVMWLMDRETRFPCDWMQLFLIVGSSAYTDDSCLCVWGMRLYGSGTASAQMMGGCHLAPLSYNMSQGSILFWLSIRTLGVWFVIFDCSLYFLCANDIDSMNGVSFSWTDFAIFTAGPLTHMHVYILYCVFNINENHPLILLKVTAIPNHNKGIGQRFGTALPKQVFSRIY